MAFGRLRQAYEERAGGTAKENMARESLIQFIEEYGRRGKEIAIAHRRGYRMERWSYARVVETASMFLLFLRQRGVKPGEHVLLWGENCAEWVAAFFGCVLAGVVVVPMDHAADASFAARVAQTVNAKLVIHSRNVDASKTGMSKILLEELGEDSETELREVRFESAGAKRSDPVEIVFTSGTTAEPRGVVLTHGNLLANIEPMEAQIRPYLKWERFFHPLRFLNLLPLSHVFGQLMGMFIPPLLGGTVILLDTMSPAEVSRTIPLERVTTLVTVPRMIESLQGQIEREIEARGRADKFRENFARANGEKFLRRAWRFRKMHRRLGWKFWAFISGGAALPEGAEMFWNRLGYAVVQGYGLTETTSLVSVSNPFHAGKRSIGKLMPGIEMKLSSEGEILVRGENIASGYFQGAKLEPVAGEEGWFRTGDLGEMDAQGNLYFKGRRKNVIVTPAGMNVYPEDLEAALRKQEGVRDAVVVGIERDGNAEPCAVLLLADKHADAAAIVERANVQLAEFQRMRRWMVWKAPDFPRTATQKPVLGKIREAAEKEFGTQVKTDTAAAADSGSFADFVAKVTGRSSVAANADLETDLQMSSLDRVELMSALEEKYQVDLSETRFAEAKTVGEMEKLLREPRARPQTHQFSRWAQRWPVTWIRLAVYYALTWPATMFLARPEIRGRENLRGVRGPVLVIANHVTYVDIGCVLAALPPKFRHRLATAMEAERLWGMRNPAGMDWFMRVVNRANYFLVIALFNVFPLPKMTGFRQSFAFAGELADEGWSVLVFPEGERSKDGTMQPFRAGIGLLATNLRLPVLPVRIDGLWELAQARLANPWLRLRRVPKGSVKVTIGAPVKFEADMSAEEIAKELEKRVGAL
ncbi:MAG TPA: AMP-binding protein [Candidatus Acidoferrales bacterium]|nr:AMP-binding protein [Candidatus Acidoferrales bacterium]